MDVRFLRYARGQKDRQTHSSQYSTPPQERSCNNAADLGILEGMLTDAVVGGRDPRDVDGRRGFGEQLDVMRSLVGGRRHRSTGTVPRLRSIVCQNLRQAH